MSTADEPTTAESEPDSPEFRRRYRRLVHLALLNDNCRLFVAAVVAILAEPAFDLSGWERVIVAWDIGAGLYLILTWWIILNAPTWDTRRWLAAQNLPSLPRLARLFGPQANLILAIAFSLAGVGSALALLSRSNAADPTPRLALYAFGVILAWLVLNTSYALYYIFLYHRRGTGLEFPTDERADPAAAEPDQLDFAYFAFTIATVFATSDVQVTDRAIRRTVLGHGVLAFAYNSAILSVAVGFLTGF